MKFSKELPLVLLFAVSCADSPKGLSTSVPIPEGQLMRAIYFAEGGATNICKLDDLFFGGTVRRQNGALTFTMLKPRVIIDFSKVMDRDFELGTGLYLHEGSDHDTENSKEDYIAYDDEIWTTDCPTGPIDSRG